MTKPYLAVVNPADGFGKCGQLVGPALNRLKESGVPLEIRETTRAGHGMEIAREAYQQGYRRFIAVGGDGTSFEIINGIYPAALVGGKPSLGFLPLGTGNSFLRDFTKNGVEYATHPIFNIDVPASVPDVPSNVLDPRGTWPDPAKYDEQARKLASMFVENFKTFENDVPASVKQAGPSA